MKTIGTLLQVNAQGYQAKGYYTAATLYSEQVYTKEQLEAFRKEYEAKQKEVGGYAFSGKYITFLKEEKGFKELVVENNQNFVL